MNLSTESLARASSRRPWVTVALWIVLLVVALVLTGTVLQDSLTTEFAFTNDPDSQKALNLLEDRLRGPKKITETVIVQSATMTVDDQGFRDKVEELHRDILALGTDIVEGGVHYYQTGAETLVSEDRTTTLMPFTMAGDLVEATDNVEGPFDIVQEANGQNGFTVLISGESSIAFESNELSVNDIEQGERIGVPVALLILIVLFGAVVAAIIPLALAIISIIVALGATALVGQVFDLIFFVTIMITMIGLAVGIDYSLIVISRYREEHRRGLERSRPIEWCKSTSSC